MPDKPKEKKISELTIVELKAVKCDCYEFIEFETQKLAALNVELQKRAEKSEDKKSK